MSQDIDALIDQMRAQYQAMREHYATNLTKIEEQFQQERENTITRNKKEIEDLFEKHKSVEEEYLAKRQQEEEQNAKQLEDVMSQDANKQAEQKIKLETEMQILEKCMEDMKAVYKLN